jgi:E3 ubiquitin-protein ligase RNF115/126
MQNDPNNYGNPPTSESALKTLKDIKLDENNLQEYGDKECSVCKENYILNDTISKLPCEHLFHNECSVTWLKMHNTCPVCRKELKEEECSK